MNNKTDKYKDVTVGDVIKNIFTTIEDILATMMTLGLALILFPPKWLDRFANTMVWCFMIGLLITSADYILLDPPIGTYHSRFEFIVVTMGLGTGIYLTSFIFYKLGVIISGIVVYRKKIQENEALK